MPGYELFDSEEQAAVDEVFRRGGVLFRYGFEERRKHVFKVAEFERCFAEYMGVKFAQAVSSGTAAVRVALSPLLLKPGDEVITQCFTFVATVESIIEAGATPVLTEVDETLNMDPIDLERKITEKTRAIVPVHMLGVAAKMDEILAIGRKYKIPVIEDSAQAPGSAYRGTKTGSMGIMGCFSFDPVKTMTTGEGGMVTTNDEELHNYMSWFADHGHVHDPSVPRGKDPHHIGGFNFRMGEIQGAIGLVQLGRLSDVLERQRRNKLFLKRELSKINALRFRELPCSDGDGGDTLVFSLPSVSQAQEVASYLGRKGVGLKILPDALNWHFSGNWPHLLERFPRFQVKDLSALWPRSADILHRAIAIPISVLMSEKEIAGIIESVKGAVGIKEGARPVVVEIRLQS